MKDERKTKEQLIEEPKVVIYNAHGGNSSLLPFLAQCSLWEEKPYCIYLPRADGQMAGDLRYGTTRPRRRATASMSWNSLAARWSTGIRERQWDQPGTGRNGSSRPRSMP